MMSSSDEMRGGLRAARFGVVTAFGHACDDDHRKRGRAWRGPKCISHGKTIHARQLDIEQDEVELFSGGDLQDRLATLRFQYFRSGMFVDSSQGGANRENIFDDKDTSASERYITHKSLLADKLGSCVRN